MVPVLTDEVWPLADWTAVERLTFQALQLHAELPWCWGPKSFSLTYQESPLLAVHAKGRKNPSLWWATDLGESAFYCVHIHIIYFSFAYCPSVSFLLLCFPLSLLLFLCSFLVQKKENNGPHWLVNSFSYHPVKHPIKQGTLRNGLLTITSPC